jgi:hypothetical protein
MAEYGHDDVEEDPSSRRSFTPEFKAAQHLRDAGHPVCLEPKGGFGGPLSRAPAPYRSVRIYACTALICERDFE